MKKCLFVLSLLTFTMSSCKSKFDESNITLSAKPEIKYNTYLNNLDCNREEYFQFINKISSFSSNLTNEFYNVYNSDNNTVISPLSIYMALAMATECSGGNTRTELLNALGLSYEEVNKYTSVLYNMSTREYSNYNGDLISMELLTNSIWMDKSFNYKQETCNSLAKNFYCYPYIVDFKNDNKNVNLKIQKFISDNTKGLINNDFKIPTETLFTIINTLYVKDVWNNMGLDLGFTDNSYDFNNKNNTTKNLKLLRGKYLKGQAIETEELKTFYTNTNSNYKLKFIIPNNGHTLDEIFTSENINYVNTLTDYKEEDDNYKYFTRTLFPEFEASAKESLNNVLSNMGVIDLFSSNCDYSNLTLDQTRCSNIIHQTKLKVDKKGIEGAAVTIMSNGSAQMPDESKEPKYLDFVVDQSFGLILTDPYNVPLFIGKINNI